MDRTQLYNQNIEVLHHGRVCLNPSWHSESVRSYFTRIYFVKNGNGFLREDGKVIPLQGGNIYLIPSDHTFDYGCDTLEKVFFHILLPAGEKTDVLAEAGKILTLPDSRQLVDSIYEVYGKEDLYSLMQVKMLIYDVINKLILRYGLQLDGGRDLSPLTAGALRYIWSHVSVKLSTRQIAQKLFVSESTLRNTFLEEIGMTLGAYVDDAVYFTVRKMLGAGFSIDDIATKLQFCDRHYLSRRFKEKFGKTISQYRKDQPI